MDELNPTVREQEIYEEMELTPEMIKSIRTLCATCLRHFVEASPKRKKQVAEILAEAEKYIWRIREEIRCA